MEFPNEYYLLRNSRDNVSARALLLKVDFVALDQMENGTWPIAVPNDSKQLVRSCVQMDIISKIMMYIEDFVVLGESFIEERDFYDEFLSPSSSDLGGVIKCFFKNIERISDDDILKIMSWVDMSSIISDNPILETAKKIQIFNISNIRKLLRELKDFGQSNHPVYKRFKHGGMPIINTKVMNPPQKGPLAMFESYSLVSIGEDPLHDIHIIPYSKTILERYQGFITLIQHSLLEMIQNRMTCIERQIPRIYPKRYPEDLSREEVEPVEKALGQYFQSFPSAPIPPGIDYDLQIESVRKNTKWYFETY